MNCALHIPKPDPAKSLQLLKSWMLILLTLCFLVSCGGEEDGEDKGPDRAKVAEAQQAFDEENYEKSKAAIEYFLAQFPDDVGALYVYAQILVKTGQLLKARDKANEILKIDPELAEPKAILGEVHYGRKEFSEALDLSREALRKNSKLQVPYRVIGEIYLRQGKIKEGITVLKEANNLAPNDVETLKKLSAGYIKAKDYASAKKHLDAAMKLKDNVPGVHYNLAAVYANTGEGQKAMEHIDLALARYTKLDTFYWTGKSRDMRRLIIKKYKIEE